MEFGVILKNNLDFQLNVLFTKGFIHKNIDAPPSCIALFGELKSLKQFLAYVKDLKSAQLHSLLDECIFFLLTP